MGYSCAPGQADVSQDKLSTWTPCASYTLGDLPHGVTEAETRSHRSGTGELDCKSLTRPGHGGEGQDALTATSLPDAHHNAPGEETKTRNTNRGRQQSLSHVHRGQVC